MFSMIPVYYHAFQLITVSCVWILSNRARVDGWDKTFGRRASTVQGEMHLVKNTILLQGCLYLIDVPHLYLLCIALNYLSSHWLRAYGYFANQRNQNINRLICRLCVQCMISKGNVKLCSLWWHLSKFFSKQCIIKQYY